MGPDQRRQGPTSNACTILTRRGLFEFAGLAFASAAFPSTVATAQPPLRQDQLLSSPVLSPLTDTLSSYMSLAVTRAVKSWKKPSITSWTPLPP